MHPSSQSRASEADPGSVDAQVKPPNAKLLLIGIALVATAAVGGFFYLKKDTRAGHVAVVRDVPRLEGNAIVFSDAFRERAKIAFSPVEQKPFQPAVRVVGTVAFNPSYVAAIGTRLRGFVRKTFKYEGDRVTEGEALAEVESAELGEAQSSIAQAQARLDAAERNARRERELLTRQLTTAREAEVADAELSMQKSALQAAQQRTKAYGGAGNFGVFVLRSPLNGHVVERNISPGQSVDGDLIGYKVADLNHLWIDLSVFERDIGFVHVGDAVVVSPVASGGVKIPGKVAHVGEIIDPATRSTGVRVAVDNPSHHLRPGQSVHATITSGDAAHTAILIPYESVVYVDGKATVFVAETETRVRPVPIHLGGSDGSRHEVLAGLEAGQRVASAGVFALKSELFR